MKKENRRYLFSRNYLIEHQVVTRIMTNYLDNPKLHEE